MEQPVVVEGRTLKHAIDLACEQLGVQVSDLEYKLDSEHFRQGADTVKIHARAKGGREKTEATPNVKGLIEGILDRMEVRAQVEIEKSDDTIRAILMTEDAAAFSGGGGQTLEALQHLVSKALVKSREDRRIVIELEHQREKKESGLKFLAQKICEKVLNERCTITLKPMNAYDRRVVHMEVARHPGLTSRSLGEGQIKRLQIYYDPNGESARRRRHRHHDQDE